MNLFENFGSPSDEPHEGDIERIDYLFLGDYVDRGIYRFKHNSIIIFFFFLIYY